MLVLIGVASLLGVVGMFAVWANRLLFSPDNWAQTSTQLLTHPAVRSATANYLVDQLYANVDVAGLLRSELPKPLAPLAGPAAGALRGVAVDAADATLTRPEVQALWSRANRAADQAFIAIVNGGKGAVGVQSGAVTLNLASIVDDLSTRLGLPSGLSAKLPPNVAHLTVFRAKQLKVIQDGGNLVRHLALWLTILVPLLYVLALFLAKGHRRRTLLSVGFAIAVVGVIGFGARALLTSQIPDSLIRDVSLRPAGRAVVDIATQILGDIAAGFLVVGLVAVLAAWFAGPARAAVTGRRWIAPFVREQPGWMFAIVAVVMLLIFVWQPIHATGTLAGIIAFSVLALVGTEALRQQILREFPDDGSTGGPTPQPGF